MLRRARRAMAKMPLPAMPPPPRRAWPYLVALAIAFGLAGASWVFRGHS